jgi:sugar phosphate isomerase/epimerase
MGKIQYSVFTKPWKTQTLDELGELVADMGFDAVEYPLRGGYQVQPEDGAEGIRKLVETLKKHGVGVASIAGGIDVAVEDGKGKVLGASAELFEACGAYGIPVIRICQGFNKALGFWDNIKRLQEKYDAIAEIAAKTGVTLGVQMHHGNSDITNSYDSSILLQKYDPKLVAAVWDAGHSGLAGEAPAYALDALWNNLCMVNFKAAYWVQSTDTHGSIARWRVNWVTGPNGMCPWTDAVAYLKKRGYEGTVCLPAEYSDEKHVEEYARFDNAYIKKLFAEA